MKPNGHGRVVATIEARMTSSRLPGKVLMMVRGRPLLDYLVDRLRQVKALDEIVLATTVNHMDDALDNFAQRKGIRCWRGSEDDVMQRVIGAAESVGAKVIAEITADCPIIDPMIVEQVIQTYLHNHAEYVSNGDVPGYPDGMCLPVLSLAALKRSAAMTSDPLDHEHVTLHIRRHPEIFSHLYMVPPPDLYWPELGVTLDEAKDYELIKCLIEHFGERKPFFGCRDVIELLRSRPEWVALNSGVRRKPIPPALR